MSLLLVWLVLKIYNLLLFVVTGLSVLQREINLKLFCRGSWACFISHNRGQSWSQNLHGYHVFAGFYTTSATGCCPKRVGDYVSIVWSSNVHFSNLHYCLYLLPRGMFLAVVSYLLFSFFLLFLTDIIELLI